MFSEYPDVNVVCLPRCQYGGLWILGGHTCWVMLCKVALLPVRRCHCPRGVPLSCSHFFSASVTALISSLQVYVYFARLREGFCNCLAPSFMALWTLRGQYTVPLWRLWIVVCTAVAGCREALVAAILRVLAMWLRCDCWGALCGFRETPVEGASLAHCVEVRMLPFPNWSRLFFFSTMKILCILGEDFRCWFLYICLNRCIFWGKFDLGEAVCVSCSVLSLIVIASWPFLWSPRICGSYVGDQCKIRVSVLNFIFLVGFCWLSSWVFCMFEVHSSLQRLWLLN